MGRSHFPENRAYCAVSPWIQELTCALMKAAGPFTRSATFSRSCVLPAIPLRQWWPT